MLTRSQADGTLLAQSAGRNSRSIGAGFSPNCSAISVILTATNILMYAAGAEHSNKAPWWHS
jgi:hypothetical protein